MDLTHRIENQRRQLNGVILKGGQPQNPKTLALDFELIDEALFYLLQMINAQDEDDAMEALSEFIEGQQDE